MSKAGRPSLYSEELAERICELLINGETMVQICERAEMPHRVTVIRWMERPEFATRIAHARDAQADYMDDLILRTAMASTSETAAADRVKIAAFQWRASKLAQKRYGDKLVHEGNAEQPVEIVVKYAK